MIKFKQIIECTVEHTPAGRRNGIDCVEVSKRGLLAIDELGDLYRYNYATKTWNPQATRAECQAPCQPAANIPTTASSEI